MKNPKILVAERFEVLEGFICDKTERTGSLYVQ